MKRNKLFPMLGIAAGVMAVIFAIVLFAGGSVSGNTGTRTSYAYYGGDAYTGIQQAGADTARNVKALSEIVLGGIRSLGFLLLALGFGLIALSGAKLTEYRAAALYEQAVLEALKGLKRPEQVPAPAAAPAPAAPAPMVSTNRWRMDTVWPTADPGAVAKKAEAIVTEPAAAEIPAAAEAAPEAAAPAAEPAGETAPEEN